VRADHPSYGGRHHLPTLGVIGGGQLARMTIQAASRLGVPSRLLAAPGEEAAPALAPAVTWAPLDDTDALHRFAAGCDVVTFDHERVCPDAVAALEAAGAAVRPGSAALRFADKAHQRSVLGEHVPVPLHSVVTGRELAGLGSATDLVVKPARGGYDGKGVHVVTEPGQLRALAATGADDDRYVVEQHLAIEQELAVLVVRSAGGEVATYPAVETRQVDGTCHEVLTPARVDPAVQVEAVRVARRVADVVGAVGVLAVELFVIDGQVLLNEVAPRPHNSGHLTIEAAATSQFENHVRAVLGWPLGPTGLLAPAAAMVNVLGPADGSDPRHRLAAALRVGGTHVHLYGKAPAPRRKLGHVTALAPTVSEALRRARLAGDLLTHTSTPAPVLQGALG
jgi:5-(carboxyamino)imidazole ribonucleotide synthase